MTHICLKITNHLIKYIINKTDWQHFKRIFHLSKLPFIFSFPFPFFQAFCSVTIDRRVKTKLRGSFRPNCLNWLLHVSPHGSAPFRPLAYIRPDTPAGDSTYSFQWTLIRLCNLWMHLYFYSVRWTSLHLSLVSFDEFRNRIWCA